MKKKRRKKKEKRKNVRQSSFSPLPVSFPSFLLRSHYRSSSLLFSFDHAISFKTKWKIIQHREDSKSSSDSCVTTEIAAVIEITIQIMNSFSYTYIQKEKRTHVVYLTNVCSKYKQTKNEKMKNKIMLCLSVNREKKCACRND